MNKATKSIKPREFVQKKLPSMSDRSGVCTRKLPLHL